jgi:hypothetical protein
VSGVIAILEDDDRRAEVMRKTIATRFPTLECVIFDNAPAMIEWLKSSLDTVHIISLDHDLESSSGGFDAGTGRDVADFLATQLPCCPVIIHTSNSIGGAGMKYAIEDAGWVSDSVLPLNDLGWIEDDWCRKIGELITAG